MHSLKLLLLALFFPILTLNTAHKFYVSVTQVDFIVDRGELQITSRIFIDDLERLIRERYDESITLAGDNELPLANEYIEKYLSQKLSVIINGEAKSFKFLGKEYEDDIALCYMEITGIKSIDTIEISNSVLFDLFEEQQNIIRMNINSRKKSFILIQGNDKALLNLN